MRGTLFCWPCEIRMIKALLKYILAHSNISLIIPGQFAVYISAELMNRAENKGLELLHTQPGKPTQNACVERSNRTVSHEWLVLVNFESIEQARFLATDWQ